MKKRLLLVFPIIFSFISLSAQIDKNDTLVVNSNISNIHSNDIESLTISKPDLGSYGKPADNGVMSMSTKDNHTISEKLVIVDGVAYTSSLDSIKAQEIESMSVMSGVWGKAHYGTSGENGVIILKTKKSTPDKK